MRYDILSPSGQEFCSQCLAEVERCNCYPMIAGTIELADGSLHSCAATRAGGDCLCFDYVGDYDDDDAMAPDEPAVTSTTWTDSTTFHLFPFTLVEAAWTEPF